jgi:predicted nucleotidyltransferase
MRWAERLAKSRTDIICIGYFGSYATNNWGVGSDLDVVMVVEDTTQPFEKRTLEWDTTALPVPVDLLIYTLEEWNNLDKKSRFYKTLKKECVWVYRGAKSND